MRRNLLIIGAGVEACEGIKIAKAMGLGLIIADGDIDAPGLAWADRSIIASTYDGESIANGAQCLLEEGWRIHGVIAMCADVPLSVAIVADKLGLSSIGLEAAHCLSDKLAMKDQLKKSGIPIPEYCAVPAVNDIVSLAEKIGYPLIIKPVDSRGARGVQYIDSPGQLLSAWSVAEKESSTGRVMMEEFLAGPQFSTETLVSRGHCHTLGFSDRNYEWLPKTKPFMIENGGDSPTHQPADVKQSVVETAEKAAIALGIYHGVAKGDMVYTSSGAKVIEIAGRLSGGYFSTTQIPLATGVNFVEKAIKLALDLDLKDDEVTPCFEKGVAIRYLTLKPGIIKEIKNIDVARKMPGIEMLKLFVETGSEVQSLNNHTQRCGFAIAVANNKFEAIAHAEDALNKIAVIYDT